MSSNKNYLSLTPTILKQYVTQTLNSSKQNRPTSLSANTTVSVSSVSSVSSSSYIDFVETFHQLPLGLIMSHKNETKATIVTGFANPNYQGNIKVGDILIKINDVDVTNFSGKAVYNLVKKLSVCPIYLHVRRLKSSNIPANISNNSLVDVDMSATSSACFTPASITPVVSPTTSFHNQNEVNPDDEYQDSDISQSIHDSDFQDIADTIEYDLVNTMNKFDLHLNNDFINRLIIQINSKLEVIQEKSKYHQQQVEKVIEHFPHYREDGIHINQRVLNIIDRLNTLKTAAKLKNLL